ncbi:MAG: hypothetical protein WCP52_06105 [Bacteroidota bacterium]
MKKIIYYSLTLTSFFALLLIFNSCKKTDTTTDSDTVAAIDCVNSEIYFCDVKNIVDEAGFKSGAFNGILNDSLIAVTYDTINHSDSDTIIINFGTSNVQCQDGRVRKGKIITTYNGRYSDTSKTHFITLTNFGIDNNILNGTIKDSYKGYNSSGHQNFHDTVSFSIAYSSNKVVSCRLTNNLVYTSGDSSAIWSDRVMAISGNSSGVASNGDGFSTLISSPLIKNFSAGCRRYLNRGIIQIAVSNKSYRVADLGDGNCDDVVVITIDGNSYQAHSN